MTVFFWLNRDNLISTQVAARQLFGHNTTWNRNKVRSMADKLYTRPIDMWPPDMHFTTHRFPRLYVLRSDLVTGSKVGKLCEIN